MIGLIVIEKRIILGRDTKADRFVSESLCLRKSYKT